MGQLTLPSSSLIYIDTVVVIYSVEWNPNYYSLLEPLWLKFQMGDIKIVSSELILMEALVRPLRNNDIFLINTYEQLLLSAAMQLTPINQDILKQAANLRATTKLKTPDAIHAATALSVNCNQFITNDQAFGNIPNLPVTILSELLSP
ncbi:type II toxin-antitoxin system VapC family toxin [Nostoc parmelioides]|uniref:PIN domain-containing protein n=1 Tax=Nostoc parmelioides FACHB-3921 TaxID=2692909 RepID=A0ABR8BI50_9NOSO|nr:PIN domain-containing protein [Nostoc parmelioides]MBD2252802.1 PIN domain-containing protein [Nostoc parmelioides FACHB-3921]